MQVLISDVALAVVGSALWRAGTTHGWGWLACVYGIPYLIVNHWLVHNVALYAAHQSSLPVTQ